jgi:hypothetical protein
MTAARLRPERITRPCRSGHQIRPGTQRQTGRHIRT